ncbi:hypothetical protein Y032_0689g1557 [Ancylostoma ceylanicum]|uniref:Uncharacterized protein n=1 Tax=Ancylostoma ceylanicum TaxID=53326 RepID=A0A016WHV3_9BILA|nr:hypothetical protein Y032_0689g1557 [Ancylostoma ceylanicum]
MCYLLYSQTVPWEQKVYTFYKKSCDHMMKGHTSRSDLANFSVRYASTHSWKDGLCSATKERDPIIPPMLAIVDRVSIYCGLS